MRDAAIVEYYRLMRESCRYVLVVRQEWPLATSDVEIVYDLAFRPLWAWKRMTLPVDSDPEAHADIRRYELRTEPATMTWRRPDGSIEHRRIPGPKPVAVVGPGRSVLGMWIRAEQLEVGEIARGAVLDFRDRWESIKQVALARKPNRMDSSVSDAEFYVHTVFGREAVFADAEGNVLGDLAGLRPHQRLDTPQPDPIPSYGTPDPRNTP
ncbi:MAG: hypothetical protein AAF355_06115 [Myxococcota bacterium]